MQASFNPKPINRPGSKERTKRLNIEISASLHQAMKAHCASRGLRMSDEIRSLLHEHFGTQTASTPVSNGNK